MTALLRYSATEASNSLARSWRASILAIGVIAAAVFAAGAVLLVSVNMDRVLARLSTTGELTVYLKQGAGPAVGLHARPARTREHDRWRAGRPRCGVERTLTLSG